MCEKTLDRQTDSEVFTVVLLPEEQVELRRIPFSRKRMLPETTMNERTIGPCMDRWGEREHDTVRV